MTTICFQDEQWRGIWHFGEADSPMPSYLCATQLAYWAAWTVLALSVVCFVMVRHCLSFVNNFLSFFSVMRTSAGCHVTLQKVGSYAAIVRSSFLSLLFLSFFIVWHDSHILIHAGCNDKQPPLLAVIVTVYLSISKHPLNTLPR